MERRRFTREFKDRSPPSLPTCSTAPSRRPLRTVNGSPTARWLRARDIEVHVIHTSSVAVSREHRRAKTDRLDTELLKRAFLGWLRGERDHCKMVAIPTLAQEDAKRPNRERESLVGEQSRIVNRMKAALARLGIRGFNPKLKKARREREGEERGGVTDLMSWCACWRG